MVILDLKKEFTRYSDILYQDGVPLLKFTSDSFIDIGPETAMNRNMTLHGVKYMQKYINMFPKNYEIMKSKNQIIKFFYDVETTGVDSRRCSIHQFTCWIEIDGEVVDKLNLHIRPHPKATIEDGALAVSGATEEQIMEYLPMEDQFKVLLTLLKKYVDPFDKGNKMFLVGFRNASFDDDFLRKYFDLMKSKFFYYFYASTIDVSVLATQYLINVRGSMPSFKLSRVAKTLGIEVDEDRLHDADYDVYLTREIYKTVSRIEENLF